jgi:hypothetical protein
MENIDLPIEEEGADVGADVMVGGRCAISIVAFAEKVVV